MTATTSTLSGPRSANRVPAFWAALALFVGGAIGASATALVNDSDTSNGNASSEVSTSADASFRSASASEAERYVDSLESRASSIGATEHGYVYAHGASAAPQTSSRMSADALEHRVVVDQPSPVSPDAAEHRAQSEQSDPSTLDSCHGATHGVC
jgi:hypothetical protein